MLVIQRPTVEPVGEEESNRQRFAISPLEPGFGHTIGNSLRRTLLSSIPGAAITAGAMAGRSRPCCGHLRISANVTGDFGNMTDFGVGAGLRGEDCRFGLGLAGLDIS